MIGNTPEKLDGVLLDWGFDYKGERWCLGIERTEKKARLLRRIGTTNNWEVAMDHWQPADIGSVGEFGFKTYLGTLLFEVTKFINMYSGEDEVIDWNTEVGKLIKAIRDDLEIVIDTVKYVGE